MSDLSKKKWVAVLLLVLVSVYGMWNSGGSAPSEQAVFETAGAGKVQSRPLGGADVLRRAFEERKSDVQVEGEGRVVKTLPDDLKGSRHQRFILQLSDGQTLLVAHNIDLAPKIKTLKKGDTVAFYGEYEWSGRGGVLHWTHHDPAGRHPDGWLRHNGVLYK